jgi:hypothetical protein
LPDLQRRGLRLDELPERRREIRLTEDLAGFRRLALLAGVRQEHRGRVLPLLDLRLLPLDPVGGLRVDRVAVGHGDRRRQHLRERQRAELLEHDEEAAGRAGRDGRERTVLWRVVVALRPVVLDGGARRRDAERVDADHLLRVRVVDERLGLAAPAERVPHRADAASIAHAASIALPPCWNAIAPAVAPSGLPVTAIQCFPCSGGRWVVRGGSGS